MDLMELLLFDRSERQIGRLLPDLADVTEIEDLNGETLLSLSYPSNADWAESIVEGNFVACKDLDGNWQLYELIEVQDKIGTIEAVCNHAFYALGGMEYVNAIISGLPVQMALSMVLNGTGWEPGVIEVDATRTATYQHMSPLAALVAIAGTWGGELRFRVDISGKRIVAKYVDLLTRRGDVTGRRFEFDRDIKDIDITVDRSAVVTALYGWGQGEDIDDATGEAERLTFANVEWIKGQETELHPGGLTSPAPCDKPLGQLWVGDDDARQSYGRHDPATGEHRHIFGEYESQAESPQALLWETWRQLQKRNEPLLNIKAQVADLERVRVVEVHDVEGPKITFKRPFTVVHPETGEVLDANIPVFVNFAGSKRGLLMNDEGATLCCALTTPFPGDFAVGLYAKMIGGYGDGGDRVFWDAGGYRCFYDAEELRLKITNGTVTAALRAIWYDGDIIAIYAGRSSGKLFIWAKV